MRIYLMRHGETDWNLQRRLQGQKDIPMNENGIRQMSELAARMRDRGFSFDRIVSSPLRRALDSAEIVAAQTGYCIEEIVQEPLLIERDFGKAEGVSYQERHSRNDEEWGMESMEDLSERALSGIKRHLEADKGSGILFVAHGAVLKAAVAALTAGKIKYDNDTQFKQGNISLLEYREGQVTEIHFNLLDATD